MTPCGVAGMAIHLGPSVARRLMRPPRGLGSAPLPPSTFPPTGAPSYLALLRVEFARFTPNDGSRRRSASSLWHWSSPHGGRALPATLRCGARTFLTPSTGHPTDDARPSDRLADRAIVQRPAPGSVGLLRSHLERDRTTAPVKDHPSRWIDRDRRRALHGAHEAPLRRLDRRVEAGHRGRAHRAELDDATRVLIRSEVAVAAGRAFDLVGRERGRRLGTGNGRLVADQDGRPGRPDQGHRPGGAGQAPLGGRAT